MGNNRFYVMNESIYAIEDQPARLLHFDFDPDVFAVGQSYDGLSDWNQGV
jgi:hypothetical protein